MNWKQLIDEIKEAGSTHDVIRRKYINKLSDLTGRNTIVYYSGWLQKGDLRKQSVGDFDLNDSDKNGFMACIHGLDRSKGLDLFLHTPGGETAATESLVDYLKSMFGTDIRAIVPQIAMSAGTMVACACYEIVMGKHSSLGPIDPQLGGIPAHGVIEEFERARVEIKQDQAAIYLWQPIIAKYSPAFVGECQQAIDWSNEMVKEWLASGMFAAADDSEKMAGRVIDALADHALTKTHARHISAAKAREIGLRVADLEDDGDLQDAVLTVHHACIQTLASTLACKIIENQKGVTFVQSVQPQVLRG